MFSNYTSVVNVVCYSMTPSLVHTVVDSYCVCVGTENDCFYKDTVHTLHSVFVNRALMYSYSFTLFSL